jgi:LuxR family maltose regulon positive regulatory protein
LIELRTADLRFTPSEAAEFLIRVMGLNLSAEDITVLENRTEGWIVGLQLAAISMHGHSDTTSFINSFSGSHHFVLDYLIEEVLQQQSESVLTFLLCTSILDRLCGSLCDDVLGSPSASGQETLENLERANLFIIPLDNERRWYRYHHLFADLLHQRLGQRLTPVEIAEYHMRASQWYENHNLDIEAFQHAAAAGEVDHALRLIEGKGIPLYHRGALVPILNWLESLPKTELDKRPALWLIYARALTSSGQTRGVEEILQAAETALQGAELSVETRDIIGCIASNRATLAYTRYQPDTVIFQAQRALEYLSPDNLPTRTITTYTLGVGYMMRGDRTAATQVFTDAISISQKIGLTFVTALATMALGNMQFMENKLYLAAETDQRALQLFGAQPLPIVSEPHFGLAKIYYEWNDLDAAEQQGQQALQLARQFDKAVDRYIFCEILLARQKLAQGDLAGANAILTQADQSVRENNFVLRMPEVAAAQIQILLKQGNLHTAAELARQFELPLSQARVLLAQGDSTTALNVLEAYSRRVEAKNWKDERLKGMVLHSIAHHAHGEKDRAVKLLGEALAMAEPGGFIRLFVDEGAPMAQLLCEAASHGVMTAYIGKLLSAFDAEERRSQPRSDLSPAQPLIEPLSQRELKILQLIAQGLSNREIGERLFLALDTVKGHNRNIFDKLQVKSRTEAVARAHELGIL